MLVPQFPIQKKKGSKGWNMVQFYVQILTNFPYHVHKNVLTLPVSLSTGSYTKDEPNFPQ